jgi:tetratricopeptide (TPR) repeat protein
MTTFQELDTYLNQEFSDDYWYDDAKFYACELVKQLTTDDWNALKSSWRNRSKQWQERCAEILDWGDARQAVPILLEMIQVEDDELILTAADSLSSIGVAELDLPVGADVLSRLQAVAHSGNVAKLIINQLLAQLQARAYHRFLIQVLRATAASEGNPQVIYPLLQANLDKLNDDFATALRSWATDEASKVEPEIAESIATYINNFSNRICEFPLGNRAKNIEIAITGYEVAVTIFTPEVSPQDWGLTQNNLGNAYRNRIQGERAKNLEVSIRCYLAALEVYTREAFPQDWANTQNNLGIAYLYRIRSERAENLEAAISCFLAALEIYTCETFPQDWAMIQNNLGEAYRNRIRGEKAENLEAAIHYYLGALEIYTREAFPQDWATTQNNLGNAYCLRIKGERAENLEAAIRCYLAALEIRARKALPEKWAITQNNLGNAYLYRIRRDRAENLEAAICSYLAALEVYTREAFPQDWAMVQNNLGEAYRNRIWGERAENLEAAIRCFSAALEVYTREAFPQNHAETQFNLGLVYQAARQFLNAYNAFATAIDTVEFLRSEIVSGDEVKQKLAKEWNKLY